MSFLEQPGFADDVRSVLTDLLGLPPAFMDYTVQYNAMNPLPIPVSQLAGFSEFTALGATVGTSLESTGSATYTDLATVGPELTELPDGKYVFIYGGSMNVSVAATTAFMSLKVNSTEGTDNIAAATQSTVLAAGVFGCLQSLSNGNSSTVVCRYRSDTTNTVSFLRRWLLGFKYANL